MVMYAKQRPNVTGDGISTIEELIEKSGLEGMEVLPTIDLKSVPKEGENVTISWKHNLGQGSLPVMLEDKVLIGKLSNFALRVAEQLNLKFASIDIVKDKNGGYKVLEIKKDNNYKVVPESIQVNIVNNANDLLAKAEAGKTLILSEDINIGSTQLAITAANVTIDLNGKTLTTANNWGGISLKNGASIKNGVINHTGNTAAIKAFNIDKIENVIIKTTCSTTDKTVTAIAVQQGGHAGSIKNVSIEGVSQGIEIGYQATVDLIDNAKVNMSTNGTAKGIGLVINGGMVKLAKNCTFKGSIYGTTIHLKGVFDAGLELQNCTIEGTTASIYAWDEKGISNTSGSLTLTYDAATELNGPFIWDFEEECQSVVTLNRPE
jgi:hypothetical protein